MTQKQSVVIIGGGPAGLTAAWEFVNNGGSDTYDVTVLEETQEFGGISRTVKHNGNRMDIGGHRFFSSGISMSSSFRRSRRCARSWAWRALVAL